jgi:glutathione S-transferase
MSNESTESTKPAEVIAEATKVAVAVESTEPAKVAVAAEASQPVATAVEVEASKPAESTAEPAAASAKPAESTEAAKPAAESTEQTKPAAESTEQPKAAAESTEQIKPAAESTEAAEPAESAKPAEAANAPATATTETVTAPVVVATETVAAPELKSAPVEVSQYVKSAQTKPFRLTYFPLKGRAEVSRALFALGGLDFEDEHIPLERWSELKSQMVLEQLPQLDIKCTCEPVNEREKSVSIAQSAAIERFLANKFNLSGANHIEAAKIDMIAEQVNDVLNSLVGVYRDALTSPENEEKKNAQAKALNETAPASLKLIQNLYDQNQLQNENSGFLVGKSVSYADVKLVSVYDWLRSKKTDILNGLPQLKQHYEKIRALPQLKDHYAKSDSLKTTIFFND